jgi:Flp pilus assembly protein TadG
VGTDMKSRTWKLVRSRRRGNVLVLTAFFMMVIVAFLALSIDIGYLQNVRGELQKSADAAAMAGAWELIDESSLLGSVNMSDDILAARSVVRQYAAHNKVCTTAPNVDPNYSNSSSGDIVVGYIADTSDPDAPMDTSDPTKFNAVQVRVRRTNGENGEVPMFFGRALGLGSVGVEAIATAAIHKNLFGFGVPPEGETLNIFPYALDEDTWLNLVNNQIGTDKYHYDPATGNVSSSPDGIKEINLFPQATGSPGNRGTVDIGGSNNSTNDLKRQIINGISRQDMLDLGKPLEFDANGELTLNGDTGISAGVKDDLAAIRSQTRIIPIFRTVSGTGNNATYTIVAWVGVRIMDSNLTGAQSKKHITIEPAHVVTRNGKRNQTSDTTSWYVYTPALLVK